MAAGGRRRALRRALAAADSYLHLPIVAGIIVFAVGMKVTIGDGGHALSDAGRLALCGGMALYLMGHGAFRLRMGGTLGWPSVAGVAALAAVYAAGGSLSALWVTGLATAALVAVCALESSGT